MLETFNKQTISCTLASHHLHQIKITKIIQSWIRFLNLLKIIILIRFLRNCPVLKRKRCKISLILIQMFNEFEI
jgi:hypothetical protein